MSPRFAGAIFDLDGTLEALVDFHLVTKWKTAGDSLLGARRLANPDAKEILIVGAGTVAGTLIEAFSAVWPDAQIRVWNRTTSSVPSPSRFHARI